MSKKNDIKKESELLEKKAEDARTKLEKLQERIEENPPEKARDKNKLAKDLNKAKRMADRYIGLNNETKTYLGATSNEWIEFREGQRKVWNEIDDLQNQQKAVEDAIKKLNDTDKKNRIREERLRNTMPEWFEDELTGESNNEQGSNDRQELENNKKRIESRIIELEKKVDTNEAKWKQQQIDMKKHHEDNSKNIKRETSRVGLFKRLLNWWKQRESRAQKRLSSAMGKAQETSSKEIFANRLKSDISTQVQAKHVAEWLESYKEGYEEPKDTRDEQDIIV